MRIGLRNIAGFVSLVSRRGGTRPDAWAATGQPAAVAPVRSAGYGGVAADWDVPGIASRSLASSWPAPWANVSGAKGI
jgi:hypothetical protein